MQKITEKILKHIKINRLKELYKNRYCKNLSITFFENLIVKFLCFIVILLVARQLEPGNYGKYIFIITNATLFSALFDFGMENTAIRFLNQNKKFENHIFGLYLLTKLLIITIITAFFIFFGQGVLDTLHKRELIIFVPYMLLIFIGESLFFVNDTYLQSVQQFTKRAIINISRRAISAVFILGIFFYSSISIKNSLWGYIIPLSFIVIFIPRYFKFLKTYFAERLPQQLLKEIYDYQKWMICLAITNAILIPIDMIMLSYLASYQQIGIYAVAYNLISIFSFVITAFTKVTLPKIAELNKTEVFDFVIKLTRPIAGLSVLIILSLPLFPFIIHLLFGDKYIASLGIFQLLTIATLLSFIVLPAEVTMYNLGKPKYIVFLNILQLILIIILDILTISHLGAKWAAINLIIGRLLFAVLLTIVFFKEKNRVFKEIGQLSQELDITVTGLSKEIETE